MTGRVEGKVALITGAARGQGRSHAVRLAGEGADIIAVDLCGQVGSVPYEMSSPEDLTETADLVRATGRRIVAAHADVRDGVGLTSVVSEAVAELGRLDIVSANAGICSFGPAHELSAETWQDMIDINLTGVWNTAKAAIPHLKEGGRGGSIVLTSSAAGLFGRPMIAHYASAKHGVVGLMRSLALELAPEMIRVNSLHTTNVSTLMIRNAATYQLFRPDLAEPTEEDTLAAFGSINALPIPWVEPDDVSNALLFLVSDEGRYVTGVTLPIDAGASIA